MKAAGRNRVIVMGTVDSDDSMSYLLTPLQLAEARSVGREEGPNRLLEPRGGSIDGGHVAALQLDEHLGTARRPVQPAPLLDRNDLVVFAVQKEDGGGDGADLSNRVERAPHEEPER